jgi:hypothetical protein
MRLAHLIGSDVGPWARRLVDDLNRSSTIEDLPVFANDAAAAAGNVAVKAGYVTPDGIVRRRVA